MAYASLGDEQGVFVHDRTEGDTRSLAAILGQHLHLTFSTEPSLCADGSRVAFRGGTATRVRGEHQTQASAFVADLRDGRVVARSKKGAHRGGVTEYAQSAVLSPDCHRMAYVAPGEFDGRDLHGNETFERDAVVVVDVATGRPVGVAAPLDRRSPCWEVTPAPWCSPTASTLPLG